MENSFIERYFQSVDELLDIRQSEEKDINSLFTYLENLHLLADKLKNKFSKDIRTIPDFVLLRLLRNYFHHVEDINEFRFFVNIQYGITVSHVEQIIIPLETFAKSIKSFIDKHTVSKSNRQYQSKLDFVGNELTQVFKCCDCQFLLENLLFYCDQPKIKCNGVFYDLGFDIFKYIYNITNVIADLCREIPDLALKEVVKNLDESFTQDNNIQKNDIITILGRTPIVTTQGYIYPE